MSNFVMPPTGFGPGSQPLGDEDKELEYMPMPQDMRTYTPRIPDVAEDTDVSAAMALMAEVGHACQEIALRGGSKSFDLTGLDAANLALVAETMGEGEVSVKIWGLPALAAQESVFAGVWRVRGDGVDRIEVAAVPQAARARAFVPRKPSAGSQAVKGMGVVNGPAIAVELEEKSSLYGTEAEMHVVNLTLLPHTEQDLEWLESALGQGSVMLLSRGYGNCRVTATGLPHVWRVQFYNSMDVLILDTFEVTDMPEVVLAANEDLVDSGERIHEVLEALK
ncbi:hydrogenase expression/formation C-terminal domain-containing protein [Sagittula sp. S175]|uniref:hydrogenase expression/formation protein n=1 Tax=Sagittula sp. S175 TaxID=3415129 RepID=UPI003C7A8930